MERVTTAWGIFGYYWNWPRRSFFSTKLISKRLCGYWCSGHGIAVVRHFIFCDSDGTEYTEKNNCKFDFFHKPPSIKLKLLIA